MALFNFKDLVWQFWARSSGDLLTLTNGKNTVPCNICSENLTSPVRLSNQPVPGVTQKEIPVGTRSFSLDFALPLWHYPQRFPSAASWFWLLPEVFLLVWHMGMKDTKFLLCRSKRIPNYCGLDWSGAKTGLRPEWFPNCWSLLAARARLRSQLLLGGRRRRQTETEVCKVIYWAQAGKSERCFSLSRAGNCGVTGTKTKILTCLGEWPTQRGGLWAFTVSCPTPNSESWVSKGSVGLTLLHTCSSPLTQKGDLSE